MIDQNSRLIPTEQRVRAANVTIAITLTACLVAPVVAADPSKLLAAQPHVWAPADAADDDSFGSSVDLDANLAAIGAMGVDIPTDGAGAVYLFEHTGNAWQETTVLRPEGVGVDAYFGSDVALEGDWLAVGGSGVYAGAGAIYLFRHNGDDWQQQKRFLLPESQDFTFFGSALDMEEGRLVAGAPGYDAGDSDSGIVMIYERKEDGSWSEAGQLQVDNPQEGGRLGSAVSLLGDRALVGADGADAAYLFERRQGEWSQVARFSENGGERSGFGASVSLTGKEVLIGAPFAKNAAGETQGTAFLYKEQNGGWTQQARLQSDTPNRSDQFGSAVALTDGMALVSSPRDDVEARDAGALYVYARDDGNWTLSGRLSLPNTNEYDEFGRSLAVDADAGTAIVGTPSDAAPGTTDSYPGTVTGYRW